MSRRGLTGLLSLSKRFHFIKLMVDRMEKVWYNTFCCRGVAQFGRALRSGRRGRGFKSRHLDHIFIKKSAVEKRSASFFLSNWEGEIIDALFLSSTSAPQKLADLRKAVGWNGMEDLYSNPSLTSFYHIAVYEHDTLIGYVDCVSNGMTDAYIQDLMVHPDYQGQGIGTELMNKITAFLKSNIYL